MNPWRAFWLGRELLSLGEDIAELVAKIGRLCQEGREQKAIELLEERQREQASGKAAYETAKRVGR